MLTWSENCVLTSTALRAEDYADIANLAYITLDTATNATFRITDKKLYLSVVTPSAQDANKVLEQLKPGSKRTIKWNKCRARMTKQTKTKNFNYLIDPALNKVNILFVLSF